MLLVVGKAFLPTTFLLPYPLLETHQKEKDPHPAPPVINHPWPLLSEEGK